MFWSYPEVAKMMDKLHQRKGAIKKRKKFAKEFIDKTLQFSKKLFSYKDQIYLFNYNLRKIKYCFVIFKCDCMKSYDGNYFVWLSMLGVQIVSWQ